MSSRQTAVTLNTLKMASKDAETRRIENLCVIYYTQYSALKVDFDKQCYTSLYSTHSMRDQVQNPHKTTGKIVALYILMFVFLEIKLEDKNILHRMISNILSFQCALKFFLNAISINLVFSQISFNECNI